MSEPFIAQVILFAGNFAPRGWSFCHGQLLSIASNTALFSILGTTYGGDGRTTFGLPELRGRAAMGPGNGPGLSPRRLGEKGGLETATLTSAQMASHDHPVSTSASLEAQTGFANQQQPSPGVVLATARIQNQTLGIYSDQTPDTDIQGADVNATLDDAGSSGSHGNMQPFLTLNYIIALVGVFPSRN